MNKKDLLSPQDFHKIDLLKQRYWWENQLTNLRTETVVWYRWAYVPRDKISDYTIRRHRVGEWYE